jgi:FO synthase
LRVPAGKALDVAESAALPTARGKQLERLVQAAARVRDAGLEAAGRPGVVTYNRKVFIPSRGCVGTAATTAPSSRRRASSPARDAPYMSQVKSRVLDRRRGRAPGLQGGPFALGDRPEDRWSEARQWLDEQGYDSTLDHVRAIAVRVLEETGLLPHLNPG